MRGKRRLVPPLALFLLFALSCGSSTTVPSVTKQEVVSLTEFNAELQKDAALADIVAFASEQGYGTLVRAGVLEAGDSIAVIGAEVKAVDGSVKTALRYCKGKNCIYALQAKTGDDVAWTNRDGSLAVLQVGEPTLLKEVDDADPTGPSTLVAPLKLQSFPVESSSNRQFIVGSAFGVVWHVTFGDLIAKATKSKQFSTVDENSYAEDDEMDDYLNSMGKDDVLVWFAHGVVSKSSGNTVGMTTNWGVMWDETYTRERIQQQLAKNTKGGPGVVFLGGCKTAGLMDAFNGNGRVVVGYDQSIAQGYAAKGIHVFFDALFAGKTYQEAIDAVNKSFGSKVTARLKALAGADLSKRLTLSGDCSEKFDGSWKGELVVTQGTDKVPMGMSTTQSCDQFEITQANGSGCPDGCYVTLKFHGRILEGCANGNTVHVVKTDSGVTMYADLTVNTNGTLGVSLSGADSSGEIVVRDGDLASCF